MPQTTLDNETHLPLENSRIPDYMNRASSQAIPLTAPAYRFEKGTPVRTLRPTTVRAILNRVENLKEDFIPPGQVLTLGNPERVLLRSGDTLEVFNWSGNKCPFKVDTGIVCSHRLLEFLDNISISKAPGGTFGTSPLSERNQISCFGRRFKARSGGIYGGVGGFMLRGIVTQDIEVEFWNAVRRAGQAGTLFNVSTDEMIDNLHQQASAYGGYVGAFTATESQHDFKVAAPGSWTYHGTAWDPTNLEEKRAVYWVPIGVKLQAPGGLFRALKVRCAWLKIQTPSGTVRLSRQQPEAILEFEPGMELFLTFLGGSVTVAELQFL